MRRNINFVQKFPQNNFLDEHIYTFLFYVHKHKTLTKPFFRAGNMCSALSSMIFGSLLGSDCTVFCKHDDSSSHMLSCVFLSYLLLKINMMAKCNV